MFHILACICSFYLVVFSFDKTQVAMIEAYLRANNMFVDYSEVRLYGFVCPFTILSTSWESNYFSPDLSLNKKEFTLPIYN